MMSEERIKIDYEKQDKVQEDKDYGIESYEDIEKDFHRDVMSLLQAEKYKELPASSIPRIMARVYSNFMIAHLEEEGELEIEPRE